MPQTVIVALLGKPEHAFDNEAFTWTESGAEELEQPWEDLPKVTLEVDESETIYAVLARALGESGIRLPNFVDPDAPPLSWVLFRQQEGPAHKRFLHELNVVDESGKVRWVAYWADVTYGELLRSAAAGAVPGDPLRPYLILLPPQGDGGVFVTWSSLLEGWRIACELLGAMATVGGAVAFGRDVLDVARGRLWKGRAVVQERYLDWDERGARPHTFALFLGLGPWHGQDLAERLGCATEEAEAILWAYGYSLAPSGIWRLDGDGSARLLRMVSDELVLTQAWNPDLTFEREMRRRTQGLLQQGEPLAAPSWEDDTPEQTPEEEFELTVGPPLEGLRLPCACGREDCHAELEFYRSGFGEYDRLVLSYSEGTNHFVIDPVSLGAILGTLAR